MRHKSIRTAIVAVILSLSLLTTSCIGSFSLTKKVMAWNNQVGSKFVNELVFVAFWIVPVYEITALSDLLVVNSIEFWSGVNPVATSTRRLEGSDGTRYIVKCDGKGYTIRSEADGLEFSFLFDDNDRSWSVIYGDTEVTFMRFIDDTRVEMIAPDGSWQEVPLTQVGLMAYRRTAMNGCYALR